MHLLSRLMQGHNSAEPVPHSTCRRHAVPGASAVVSSVGPEMPVQTSTCTRHAVAGAGVGAAAADGGETGRMPTCKITYEYPLCQRSPVSAVLWQVLVSELLPPTVGDQALADMLRSLPDSPETLDRVVAAVFSSCPPAAAAGAAADEGAGAPLPLQVQRFSGGALAELLSVVMRM